MDNEKTNHDDHDHDDHEKKEKKYVCNICNQSFSSGQGLGGHMRTHFPRNPITPNPNPNPNPNPTIDLARTFDNTSKSNLTHVKEVHIQEVGSHNVVSCSGSGSSSGSGSGSSHSNSQTNHDDEKKDKRYVCNICDLSFSSFQARGSHNRQVHSSMKNLFDLIFPFGQVLECHMRLQNVVVDDDHDDDEKGKWVCTTCNKKFTSYQALGGHKTSHNRGKNSIHVKSPNSNSTQTLNLTRIDENGNGSNRTGEKEVEELVFHKCEICDQNFPSGQDLEGHMRSHNAVSCSGSSSGSGSGSGQSSSQTGQGVGRTTHEFDLNVPAVAEDDEDATVE